jgi:hypothetical protein
MMVKSEQFFPKEKGMFIYVLNGIICMKRNGLKTTKTKKIKRTMEIKFGIIKNKGFP